MCTITDQNTGTSSFPNHPADSHVPVGVRIPQKYPANERTKKNAKISACQKYKMKQRGTLHATIWEWMVCREDATFEFRFIHFLASFKRLRVQIYSNIFYCQHWLMLPYRKHFRGKRRQAMPFPAEEPAVDAAAVSGAQVAYPP